MTFSEGFLRTAPLLLASLVLSGCLPPAPGDEEKEPYYMAGMNHLNAMDFKGAIESFEKALEVNPKSAPAHFQLGSLYEKESDPAAAIYHYERYLKLLPNSGKEDLVKPRILACKQQLAQSISWGPLTEKQRRDLEQTLEDNKRLREELEKWHAYAIRLQNATNQSGTGSVSRVVQNSAPGAAAAIGPASPNPAKPERSAITPEAPRRTHVIKPRETLSLIARKYNVKLEALMAANPKLDSRRLRVGQTLTIPAS
ncbi:MAG: LysM peptidoglycan-binding domain-containing protein [Verrucomicrobia bacterium]|nr:LysM peptidoglycan-binding domain-containing protein [Verrucomicrobiota bacterium]